MFYKKTFAGNEMLIAKVKKIIGAEKS